MLKALVLRVSRSGFYARLAREPSTQAERREALGEGNCWDIAVIDAFFARLKVEPIHAEKLEVAPARWTDFRGS